MAKQSWKHLLETAPTKKFEGRLVRCIPQLTFQGGDPPSYLFTSGLVNRCNPKGVHCIYMGHDKATAEREYGSYYEEPEPQLTYFAEFSARAIIDLEAREAREHFGLTDADFFDGFRLKTSTTTLQSIGRAISRQERIVAIRFPSNACHAEGASGFNWAIFPDSIHAPDSLKILGRGGANLEEWPKA